MGQLALSEDKSSVGNEGTTIPGAEGRAAREPSRPRGNSARHGTTTAKAPPRDLGGALRSIYQTTIGEDIPPEMLDLLGKLD